MLSTSLTDQSQTLRSVLILAREMKPPETSVFKAPPEIVRSMKSSCNATSLYLNWLRCQVDHSLKVRNSLIRLKVRLPHLIIKALHTLLPTSRTPETSKHTKAT